MRMSANRPVFFILFLTGLLVLSFSSVACRATRQFGNPEPKGFLGDYSDLKKGEKGEARLIYIKPNVTWTRWARYKAVMIDSVTFWHGEDDTSVSPEDQQKLTDHLYQALHKQLSKDYEIVDKPGPGVLRIRAAITQAKGANVAGNVVTGVVPQIRLASMLVGLSTNTAKFVGGAAIEGEVTDSVSNERLLAAVDERAGTKRPDQMFSKWGDVEKAFDFWADRLRQRLESLRKGGGGEG